MRSMRAALFGAASLLLVTACQTPPAMTVEGWTQWGGPHANFVADADGLAAEWPDTGPPEVWSRDLGEGYSGILVESDRLFTMFRDGEMEVAVALDTESGKTVWEHRYASSPREGHVHQFGDGPRATPLIAGRHIYTIGIAGVMHCLDKQTGAEIWSHDLWEEFGGNILNHGYSSSPIAYEDTVIALVGGKGASVVAFDMEDGTVRWKALDFENSYSTPRLLQIDGEQQLVAFMATELIGVDPRNGELRWAYPHENKWRQNVNTPVMADANHLFLSSPQAGARGLRLTREADTTEVEEIWSSQKIEFYHGTSVRQGDFVYGSTGTMAPAFMAAVNIRTGEIAWRERGFAKANCVLADGRLIILDEDGNLALATADPQGLTVHSKVPLLTKVAWTVPTIVGQRLYARDQDTILALDLS